MYFKSFTILWRNVENNRCFSFDFNHEKWSQTVKRLGFSPATIGIREKSDKDDEKVINGECEIVFGTLESWLPKSWMKELKERKLGWQMAEVALDELHSVTEWYIWLFMSLAMAFGFMFSLNYIKWIEIILHAVILVYTQLELPTIIIKLIDPCSNSDQLYFSRQTKVWSCAQDPNVRNQKHWLGQEIPHLCEPRAYSSLFCTISLPNSWYRTVRFANFKGILGFSVLSIILEDLSVLFLRQSCMGCDLKTQNPFKVCKTRTAIQRILGTFITRHVIYFQQNWLIYKRWPRRGHWKALHTRHSACKLAWIPPCLFGYFDIWHVYTRWPGRGSGRIEVSKKMLTGSPILTFHRFSLTHFSAAWAFFSLIYTDWEPGTGYNWFFKVAWWGFSGSMPAKFVQLQKNKLQEL